MKTTLYAQIYNPNSSEIIYKMRKNNVNLDNFFNSDIFSIALETYAKIYLQTKI